MRVDDVAGVMCVSLPARIESADTTDPRRDSASASWQRPGRLQPHLHRREDTLGYVFDRTVRSTSVPRLINVAQRTRGFLGGAPAPASEARGLPRRVFQDPTPNPAATAAAAPAPAASAPPAPAPTSTPALAAATASASCVLAATAAAAVLILVHRHDLRQFHEVGSGVQPHHVPAQTPAAPSMQVPTQAPAP